MDQINPFILYIICVYKTSILQNLPQGNKNKQTPQLNRDRCSEDGHGGFPQSRHENCYISFCCLVSSAQIL